MGTSTFSGPLRAGPIKYTTGTTLGQDIADIGEVVLSQKAAVTQAGPGADGVFTTDIVIPAGSTITSMQLFVTTVWDGSLSTLGITSTAGSNVFTSATGVAGGTLGIISATAGADATRVANWVNVGTTDVRIKLVSGNTGGGAGTLVVNYVQHGTYAP